MKTKWIKTRQGKTRTVKNKYNCPSKIWKKFQHDEALAYNRFYSLFLNELKTLSDLHNESIAHNLACYVAWQEHEVI